jgi:aldose 1-epimerase
VGPWQDGAVHRIGETSYEGRPALRLESPDGVEAVYAPGIGMVGCSLRHEGDELLGQRGGLAKYEATGSSFGIPLLHPWANRLDGLEYGEVRLDPERSPVRRDPNGLPIHGLLAASPHWAIDRGEGDDRAALLTASLDFAAHPDLMAAFPFPHRLEMQVRLAGTGLTVVTTLTPTGADPVPVSFGYHPYLALPGVPRQEWRIELPVTRRLLLDERGLPTGADEPAGHASGRLDERSFDDLFAGLTDPAVFALEGGGRRIEVEFGDGYPFAQVYAPPGQELICFEPMTAPTNALVSRDHLPLAEPGDPFRAEFEIRASRAG